MVAELLDPEEGSRDGEFPPQAGLYPRGDSTARLPPLSTRSALKPGIGNNLAYGRHHHNPTGAEQEESSAGA